MSARKITAVIGIVLGGMLGVVTGTLLATKHRSPLDPPEIFKIDGQRALG